MASKATQVSILISWHSRVHLSDILHIFMTALELSLLVEVMQWQPAATSGNLSHARFPLEYTPKYLTLLSWE